MAESSQPRTSTGASIIHSFGRVIGTLVLLAAIVGIGGYLRFVNLGSWDGGTGYHPDERFMHYTVVNLEVPADWRTYFVTSCPSPMPAPRNPGSPQDQWEPSAASGCSTLNPRNFVSWSAGYVYGTLPTTLTRLLADATGFSDIRGVLLTGRALSAGADIATLLALLALAWMLYGRRAALLAAALYALAVMPIQQAHFFTVDSFAVCFGTLALLFTTRLARRGRWYDALLAGLCVAAAVASKINMAALVGLIFLALAQRALIALRPMEPRAEPAPGAAVVPTLIRLWGLLALSGLVTFAAFRIFQPDAFTGPSWWNIGLEARFLRRLNEARVTASGAVDIPPGFQWADRVPWLFPLQNMVLWGMGLPLGVAAWLGWAAVGWRVLRSRAERRHAQLIPWVWVGFYFLWQGQQFVASMRYFLPIYPPLAMFAAVGLLRLLELHHDRWRRATDQGRARLWRAASTGLLAAVVASTLIWAWGYTRIYTRPYTRVAAASWMAANAPDAISTWELWDDPLPRSNIQQITTYPYAEDEAVKFVGGSMTTDPNAPTTGLLGDIASADYIVLTSPRVYGSVVRVPQRFPATVRYYEALFDGSLGYELAADITSYPEVLGIPINDQSAEEAFWVYDHPRVLIFRRTPEFSLTKARQLLVDDTAWREVYRGLLPAQINRTPTALQLTERAWTRLTSFDSGYLFRSPLGTGAGTALWVAAIELLALAAWGLLRRMRLPLADGGLGAAPMLGLIWLALPPAVLGALGVPLSRTLLAGWAALLLGAGLAALLLDGRAAWRELRARRWALVSQLVFGGVLAGGLLVLRGGHSLAALDESRWMALLRTPTLPPYDALFAGGIDPLPYGARLPFAILERLLGLEPALALRLALATALALAVVGSWSAIYNGAATRSSRRMALLALGGAALLLVPGLAIRGMAALSLVYALVTGSLDLLALLALLTTTLGLGTALLRPVGRWRPWPTTFALVLPLALLRGYGIFPLLMAWLTIGAAAWCGARGAWRPWLRQMLLLLVGALVLGRLWSWSVAVPTLPATTLDLGPVELALGLLLPLLVCLSWTIGATPRLADALTAALVGGTIAVIVALVSALRLPLPAIFVPPLMGALWLTLQAWLPTLERSSAAPRWRTGLVFATLGAALLTFTPAALMLRGGIGGDGYQLFAVGLALLVCAAGWALPLLRRGWALGTRRRSSLTWPIMLGGAGSVLLVGLWLLASVVGFGRLQAASTAADSSPEQRSAARWLASSAPAGTLVTAAQSVPSALTSLTGTPTLLAAPDGERWLRNAVQPAVNRVIDGRSAVVKEIYGGDVAAAQRALATYRVGHVLLGPTERTVYGASAGAALEALHSQGQLEVAYEEGDVRLYRATPPETPPPYVKPDVALALPADRAQLSQPAGTLATATSLSAPTRNGGLALGLWLLLIEALGIAAYPLTSRVFGRWHDRGWSLSKLVGLLVWGYLTWLPVSLGWWSFGAPALVAGGAALLGISALALWPRPARAGSGAYPLQLPSWRTILECEALFLTAFGIWALVRAANPDLWHPYYGGEKPFEFGFLNAILRSTSMPPYDPFFSGGVVNYYYYGLYLAALPIKAIGVDSALGFNLAIALLLAYTVAGAWTLGRELTGRRRYGLLAVVLTTGLGTLASAVKVNEARGLDPVLLSLREGLSGFGTRLGAWFWGPSRVVPYTINEFPLFGFLFADLHPHLIALPITLLAMACALELSRRRHSWAALGLTALVLGTLAAANSWDAPTYALLAGGALVGGVWRAGRGAESVGRFGLRLLGASFAAIVMTAAGVALYTPFFQHYQAMVGGIGLARRGETPLDYALIYGPLLYLAVSLIAGLAWATLRALRERRPAALRAAAIGGGLLLVVLLLAGAALQETGAPTGWSLRLLLGLLGGLGISLAFVAKLSDERWLALWLATVGCLVALGTQIVFVRDHLDGSDWERMNTVFKFGVQIWALWAIAGAAAVPLMFRLLRRRETLSGIWLGLLIFVALPGLLYPLAGIPSRLGTRFDPTLPLTLDGLAFLKTGRYKIQETEIDLAADAEAIDWLKANVPGSPVVATSEAEFYRAYGVRVAANTGLPTILGRLHEDEQRSPQLVYERERDVQRLFNSPDAAAAAEILKRYDVAYLYVGPVERALYDASGIAKFGLMSGLEPVFDNGGVQIYRVDPAQLGALATRPAALVTEDSHVADLRTRLALAPGDGAVALQLGQRLAELNRHDEAIEVLQSAADQHPADVAILQLLGDLQVQLGQGDAAVAAWQRAVDAAPSAANVAKLGVGLVWLGRWEAAEPVLQRVIALDETLDEPYFYLGELYRGRAADGDTARAVAAYSRYLERSPADGSWRKLAEAHLQALKQ